MARPQPPAAKPPARKTSSSGAADQSTAAAPTKSADTKVTDDVPATAAKPQKSVKLVKGKNFNAPSTPSSPPPPPITKGKKQRTKSTMTDDEDFDDESNEPNPQTATKRDQRGKEKQKYKTSKSPAKLGKLQDSDNSDDFDEETSKLTSKSPLKSSKSFIIPQHNAEDSTYSGDDEPHRNTTQRSRPTPQKTKSSKSSLPPPLPQPRYQPTPNNPISTVFKEALLRFHQRSLYIGQNGSNFGQPGFTLQFPIPNNKQERVFLHKYKDKYGYPTPTPQLGHSSTLSLRNRVPKLRLLVPKSPSLLLGTVSKPLLTTLTKTSTRTKTSSNAPPSLTPFSDQTHHQLPKLYVKMKGDEPMYENGRKVVIAMVDGNEKRILTGKNGIPIQINGRYVILAPPPARQRSLFSTARHTMAKVQEKLVQEVNIEQKAAQKLAKSLEHFQRDNKNKKNGKNSAFSSPEDDDQIDKDLNWVSSVQYGPPHCYLVEVRDENSNLLTPQYQLSSTPSSHGSIPLHLVTPPGQNTQPLLLMLTPEKEKELVKPFSYAVQDSEDSSKQIIHHCFVKVHPNGVPIALDSISRPINPPKKMSTKERRGKEYTWTTITPTPFLRRNKPPTQLTKPVQPKPTQSIPVQNERIKKNKMGGNSDDDTAYDPDFSKSVKKEPISNTTTTTTINQPSSFNFNTSLGLLIEADNQLLSQMEQREMLMAIAQDNSSPTQHSQLTTTSTTLVTTSLPEPNFSELQIDPTSTLHDNTLSKCLVQIQNMVGVVYLGCPVDLREIAMSVKNAEYNPRRFMSVVIRLRDPRTTALLFRSGKLLITGARTEHQTRLAARKCARLVQKLGHPNVSFNDFTISNMVGAADVRFPVNLPLLAKQHGQYCEFEPEIFPAVIYRMQNPNVVALIFVNGKVVLTAGKRREDLYTAFEHLHRLLLDFKKGCEVDLMGTAQVQGTNTGPPGTGMDSNSNPFSIAYNTTTLGERSLGTENSMLMGDDHD